MSVNTEHLVDGCVTSDKLASGAAGSLAVSDDIDFGASGAPGNIDIFPPTASKGKLNLAAADNAGDTTTTVTNASQAGARTYTIPDAGASAEFVMSEGSQTINGAKAFTSLTSTNLDLGTSGTAGSLDVFPTTASKGKLSLVAGDSAGDTTTSVTNASQAGARTYTIPDAGNNAQFCMLTAGQSSPGVLSATDLAQRTGVFPVPFTNLRGFQDLANLLSGTGGTTSLGLVTGTFLTDAPVLKSGDLKSAGVTVQQVMFEFPIPDNYVAGQDITVRLNVGMVTTISDTSANIDVQVVRHAAPTVDICATAAQSFRSLTAADKDFVLTGTTIVTGDNLLVCITSTVEDGAGSTGVYSQINSIQMRIPVK